MQRTFTILSHWVPFPAPGPPRTNTTRDFAIDDIPLTATTSDCNISTCGISYTLYLTYNIVDDHFQPYIHERRKHDR
jgi:hypothetical protein